MSSIVSSLIDYLRSKASAHPNRTRLLMLLCAYVALRRALVRRKSVLDNVVLITGGGSGVGRQVASRFALLGAKVVLWDINEAGLQQSSRDIASAGGKVWAYTVDVTDKQARIFEIPRVH
jgi:all-trans-retinol dehydrogenase (NAD+)